MKTLINMAADRGAFIDQSQSFNVHMQDPTFGRMTSMHFYAWQKGAKTGLYYLRTKPKADAIQFTVDQAALAERVKKANEQKQKLMSKDKEIRAEAEKTQREVAASQEDDGECLMCGS